MSTGSKPLLLLAGLLAWAAPAVAQAPVPSETAGDHAAEEAAAAEAAVAWLALVDAGDYDASHAEAAAAFQAAVTPGAWAQAVAAARGPIGEVTSRDLSGAEYQASLPNAPDGEYVLLRYRSSFESLANAVETLAMMKEEDGSWRTAGYFVQPTENAAN
jgi:hypothetical protein